MKNEQLNDNQPLRETAVMHGFYENLSLNDLDGEIWIDCIGYDGIYQVSNLGRIKSLAKWKEGKSGSGYLTKEKIRKQSISKKHSSVRCTFWVHGKPDNCIVSRIVFFSFNYNVPNLQEYFVMHKDGNWKNNRLENLKIATRSEIEKLKFSQKKVEHLKFGNPILSKHKRANAITENGIIKELKCIHCNKIKAVKFFRGNRNSCMKCDSDKWHFEKLNKKRVQGFEVKETEIETGKITIYNNFNDKDLLKKVSICTAIRYAKSGKICKPKPQSKNHFKPFKLEVLKT